MKLNDRSYRKTVGNTILPFLFSMFLISCGSKESSKSKEPVAEKKIDTRSPADKIPALRKEISKKAIASYKEKTDDPLNDWYFKVELFETEKTFHYLMKLEYETIEGIDTLRLPNFGTMPEPVIQKGPEKYSCIVGFLDKDKKFREYKKVYVKNEVLKVTAIKHYAVSTYLKVEEEGGNDK